MKIEVNCTICRIPIEVNVQDPMDLVAYATLKEELSCKVCGIMVRRFLELGMPLA